MLDIYYDSLQNASHYHMLILYVQCVVSTCKYNSKDKYDTPHFAGGVLKEFVVIHPQIALKYKKDFVAKEYCNVKTVKTKQLFNHHSDDETGLKSHLLVSLSCTWF